MAITQNVPCPACQEMGHDSTGDHLMIFADGGQYCNRAHFHKSGKPYYKKKGDKNPVFEHDINGKIKYTVEQFRVLEEEGKLEDPTVRLLALGGMRERDRYEVMSDAEQEALEKQWAEEIKHFDKLKVKNLVSRGIRGEIAKLYDVRVGLDKRGKVSRHYYPVHNEHSELTGAICRNLPKDFRTGKLGKTWGDKNKLFGQHTAKAVAKSGARKDTLLIVGGQLDALAAQQMLCESRKNTQWESQLFHVWSVQKGEAGVIELAANATAIRKYKKVIFCFDNDEVGLALNKKACQLFKANAAHLILPDDIKDPNQALLDGRGEEFVDAWWKADKMQVSSIKTIGDLWEEATQTVTMGISWPWPTITELTFGIRFHNLYVIGGGSGVGKTETAKEVIEHLVDHHHKKVGVIFMEEAAAFTARVLAGKWINKKIHLPKNQHPKGHEKWDEGRDYTDEEAIRALADLRDKDMIRIAATEGDNSIDNIMCLMEELRAMGCKYIFVDNLTTIQHEGKEGSVKAIDESMRRFGSYMQEEEVAIFLLSHLAKPQDPRTPYELGGEVRMGDFRGSQSIAFWATFMLAVERNTQGDREEKLITYLRCVKDRLTGTATGELVTLKGNPKTGRLLEPQSHTHTPVKKEKKKGKKGKKKPKNTEGDY